MLYVGFIVAIFLFLSFLYYQKESKRVKREVKLERSLELKQCERLARFSTEDVTCESSIDTSEAFLHIQKEIAISSLLVLFFALTISFFLAKLSLRPMQEAQKLMDNFIESMIHDLNTPIASAKLNISALEKILEDEKTLKRVKRVDKSLDNLLSLQAQLRASVKDAKMKYVDEEFEMSIFIEEITSKYELVEFTCNDTYRVLADKLLIERVIDNLISNAIKYNSKSQKVEVTLVGRLLHVKDFGIGIEDTNKIFERYYREKSSMSGLGIGLMIVQSVCEHYAIGLHVESTLGEGSTFSLDFSSISKQ